MVRLTLTLINDRGTVRAFEINKSNKTVKWSRFLDTVRLALLTILAEKRRILGRIHALRDRKRDKNSNGRVRYGYWGINSDHFL